jgi:hypothetical protein
MKALPLAAIVLVCLAANHRAVADDGKAACFDAAEKGQALRAAHKLVEARDQFRACARETCPTTVRGDCLGWLDQSDKSIPTVVLSAKDPAGNDVFDVTVTLDGAPLATKLEGVAIPVDPGAHTFRFQWADGTAKERQVLVPEGQKDMIVAVSLAPPGGAPLQPQPQPLSPPIPPILEPPPVRPAASSGVPWHTVGWIAGGTGVAGLAIGGIFTGLTLSDKSAAGCNETTKTCTHYVSLSNARTVAPVAGAGLIAGGALVVTGALLLLLTNPSKEVPPGGQTAGFALAPTAVGHGGGALFEGVW